jgi:hypothetical protein
MRKLAYLAVLLSGLVHGQELVAIDYNYHVPADFPKLDERITYLDQEAIYRFCNVKKNFPSGLVKIRSCAVLSFEYDLCMIYVQPNDEASLKHERAHCAGYNHVGEAGKTVEAWEIWKGKRTGGLTAPQ